MADTQILPLGTSATPADYIVADAQTVTVGSIFAAYNGSGAAGSYVPTVDIISDSGHTVISVPHDNTIAAGSNANASWAPFLKTAAAAPPTGVFVPHLYGVSGVQSIPNSTVTDVNVGSVVQTSTTTFTWDTTGGSPLNLRYTQPFTQGTFLFWFNFEWAGFAGDRYAEVVFSDVSAFSGSYQSRQRGAATPSDDSQVCVGMIEDDANLTGHIRTRVFQASGASKNLNSMTFTVLRLQDIGLQ